MKQAAASLGHHSKCVSITDKSDFSWMVDYNLSIYIYINTLPEASMMVLEEV